MTTRKATPDEIKRIQQALADRGFYDGEIDGIAGPQTRAAIDAYQDSTGEEGEGYLTPAQLIELGVITAPAKRSSPISDFFTNLIAQKGAEFVISKLKGTFAMELLVKSKTAITGAIMILVGAASLVAPIIGLDAIPGFDVLTAGEAWISVTGGFGLIFMRAAVAKKV